MTSGSMWRRVAAAAVLAGAMGLDLGAQSYNAIGSGGPLWWFPENDASYSRHHDLWHMSYFEALNDDWGVATSFPTIPGEVVWVSDVSGAPENSACDRQNLTDWSNVGPPYPDDGNPMPRTARTPSGMGGFAGLQLSMHIGEWWQGMKYRGYMDDATARAFHFSGVRGFFNPAVFGWFDVRTRDGAGVVQRPPLYDAGRSVMWINPLYTQWQLWGGGGFNMPCLGISMVQMHGVDRGGAEKVWPPTPVGADDGECWSNARPLVLRVNSEARCEPNLAERYDYTVRFWTGFDAAPGRPAPVWIGGSHLPLFPPDYSAPYVMARRGEVAVFTASELASASPPTVPWAAVSYPDPGVSIGTTRGAMPSRFLDPNRVDPFGGASYGAGTVELYNSDLNAIECLEMGEPGWDAATGTLNVDCAHGRENSPNTARVNRAMMGHGTAERTREVGPVDNSRGYGGRGLARRHAGLWAAPAGFGWFEHRNATLGCLFLEAEVSYDLAANPGSGYFGAFGLAYDAEQTRLEWQEEMDDQNALFILALARGDWLDAIVARARARRAFRIAYGWELIRDYRVQYLPEMVDALGAAAPYGYDAPRSVLRANGRILGHGGNACVTNIGGGYNEALVPSRPALVAGVGYYGQSAIPGQGGAMWYGQAFDGYGAHVAGEQGDHYSQFADVAGRTTPYSEAVINPGSDYPEELRAYSDYNNVRLGSTVWRDFACYTAHNGYYGMGLTRVGAPTLDHREHPNQAWLHADPNVILGDITSTQYSSGTPCVGDAAYDAVGADGTRRCFDPAAGLGAYSSADHPSADGAYFMLEYSGDGSSDTGRSGSVGELRPTPYRMIDGSETFELDLRSSFFQMHVGYRSLDVERRSIWFGYGSWSNSQNSSWLLSGEAFEGVAPAWCAGDTTCDPTQAPMDWGRLEHQGQLRWYGAGTLGGTGGCILDIEGGTALDGKPPQGSVMLPTQRIVCLLPTDAGPDGRCPGENLP